MNKVLPIILVVALFGCAKSFQEVYLEYESSRMTVSKDCYAKSKTFVQYWRCYLDWNHQWALTALKNNDIDFERYQSFEYNRKLQHNGMFPLAEALDAKKITYDEYLKGLHKVNDLISQAITYQGQARAARAAVAREEANRRTLQTLQILNVYANTMRALQPQQTYQPVIIPQQGFRGNVIPTRDLYKDYR